MRRALATFAALATMASAALADGSPLTRRDHLTDLRGRVAAAAAWIGSEPCGSLECFAVLERYGLDPDRWEHDPDRLERDCERRDEADACDWLHAVFMSDEMAERHEAHRNGCRDTPDHDDCALFLPE
jgi:hypothetical protein